MSQKSLEETIREEAKKRNNTHFMIVDGISSLLSGDVKQCQSSYFDAFGLKWNLLLHSELLEKDCLAFYLFVKDKRFTDSNFEVECSFKLSLVSQTYGENIWMSYEKRFNEKNQSSWGWIRFTSREVKERCIVNDKAVFCVEITTVFPKDRITKGTAERVKLMKVPRNNSRFTWKITCFSSFTGKSHSSNEFIVGERRWKLEMYPKGDEGGDGHLSLYLTATNYVPNSPQAPTMVIYKLRVLDQLKRNHYEINCEQMFPHDPVQAPASCGISKFFPLDELHRTSRGLLVNDEIYFGVEFLFVSTSENL